MKKFISAFAALALLTSCGPSTYTMLVGMRYPSKSGLAPVGKDIAVLYLHDKECSDTLFNNRVADAVACSLEDDYFGGASAVQVYSMEKLSGDYSSLDSMALLATDLGPDVLFLVDTPDFYIESGKPKVNAGLYAYDTMGKDSVYRVYARAEVPVTTEPFDSSQIKKSVKLAEAIGKKMADNFISTWNNEYYTVYYFDTEASMKAVELASEMKWENALEIWLRLVKTKNLHSRSCFEYNVAVACYMLGEYDLAVEWLNQSESDSQVVNASALRKRIEIRKNF
ncbi:MAG: DUF6340 family protein [Bacteroidales bacterium]|nr:DUF6340 family protein [Bacteroidales bacterium]